MPETVVVIFNVPYQGLYAAGQSAGYSPAAASRLCAQKVPRRPGRQALTVARKANAAELASIAAPKVREKPALVAVTITASDVGPYNRGDEVSVDPTVARRMIEESGTAVPVVPPEAPPPREKPKARKPGRPKKDKPKPFKSPVTADLPGGSLTK